MGKVSLKVVHASVFKLINTMFNVIKFHTQCIIIFFYTFRHWSICSCRFKCIHPGYNLVLICSLSGNTCLKTKKQAGCPERMLLRCISKHQSVNKAVTSPSRVSSSLTERHTLQIIPYIVDMN